MNKSGHEMNQAERLTTQLVLSRAAWTATMSVMEIDFPEDLLEPFEALARRRGMTAGELLVEAFEKLEASEGKDNDQPSQPIESLADLHGSVRWDGDLDQSR